MKASLARGLVVGLAFLAAVFQAAATPIDVTYTASGSTGNWTYDFSVTNNFGGTNDLYAMAVLLPSATFVTAPPNWIADYTPTYKQWCYISCAFSPGNILPGQALGGFLFHDITAAEQTNISWIAFASGGYYSGPIDYGNPYNPGIAGQASATPLPAAFPLFAGGLGVIGLIAGRRRRKASTALATAGLKTCVVLALCLSLFVVSAALAQGGPPPPLPAAGQKTIDIYDNHGGSVAQYDARWAELARLGVSVRVVGPCKSACVILMAHIPRSRICVTPEASFGFHLAGSARGAAVAARAYSSSSVSDLNAWIAAHGGPTHDLMWMSAPDTYRYFRKC